MVLEMKFEIEKYAADTFLPYVGQTFIFESLDDGRRSVKLELVEVKKQSDRRPAGFREPFALLFVLRSEQQLGTVLHRIVHADFEPSEWFLTRVLVPGRDSRLAYYEAVFG